LKTVAERLLKLSRPHDVVARFGGDEFAMLMEAPCPAGAGEALADSITTSLADPIFWEDQQVNIGSSIGLIYGPADYQNAEDIMRNADTAMYAAKSAGRGRYIVFDPKMQDAAHQRAQLSNDLQSALGDTEQIHVLYQPILSVKDNAIMGFEALARWRHPQFGDIGPDEFVKVAEQSGAIRQLGRTVMRKAFTQLTQAGSRLPDLSRLWLSVNLSPAELSAPDFVESVAAVIRETDFDPSRLYLEITESRVIDSGDQANRILSRLREFGIRVSIDDFGAGYSSLRYLQELDLDLIKIDKGFLKQPNGTDSREEILRAIIALAAAFSLPVCAEGVETAEQLKLVRAIGFQYAQGRIWGEPLSIEEIEARFTVNAS
jgi:predicted signal transduction protein with EAL and GGDEF domain